MCGLASLPRMSWTWSVCLLAMFLCFSTPCLACSVAFACAQYILWWSNIWHAFQYFSYPVKPTKVGYDLGGGGILEGKEQAWRENRKKGKRRPMLFAPISLDKHTVRTHGRDETISRLASQAPTYSHLLDSIAQECRGI